MHRVHNIETGAMYFYKAILPINEMHFDTQKVAQLGVAANAALAAGEAPKW